VGGDGLIFGWLREIAITLRLIYDLMDAREQRHQKEFAELKASFEALRDSHEQ